MSLDRVLAGDHRFSCSSQGDVLLARLQRDFRMPEKWQVARLAMAVSLSDPSSPRLLEERGGSSIRAVTLFQREDGPAVASLVVEHAGQELAADALTSRIEAHWERGMTALGRRVDTAQADGGAAEDVLVALVRESQLKARSIEEDPIDGLDRQIVGQSSAKEVVGPLLLDALASDPPILEATLLFTGPASAGKTLFSRTIAGILDLPFVDTNGTTLRTIDELLDRIELACLDEAGTAPQQTGSRGGLPVEQFPPAVVLIDECHALPRSTQTELLTATEPSQREAKTNDRIVDLRAVTFLLATTDSARLLEPLRTRARSIGLQPYGPREMAQIIARRFPGWPEAVYQRLSAAGRMIPRLALTQGEDFERFMRQRHTDELASERFALAFMEQRGMDADGLVAADESYLAQLAASDKPIGIQAIAAQLRLEELEVQETVEPYLVGLGLIERTPSGRQLTSRGRERLRLRRAP